ncbi:hypothetical protein EG328_008071 [Venturia inaequalis]|uniref:Uncharacterized protein n=2 Tax=Venturia inaequalis TaxID=5025 RepID=A0A8H3UCT6_VENIN|nr:hypothetical protein EG328_008071 [Venturia inaequalis]
MASMITTGSILQVDRGCYHPLHLLLLQLAPIFLFTFRRSQTPGASCKTRPPLVAAPSKTLWISLVALALSLPLFAQAIVHLNHVATLAMLMSLILLAENIFAQILTSRARRIERICGIIAISFALFVVLFDEYKLTVNGLLFGLFALGLAAIGKTLFLSTLWTDGSQDNVPGKLSWNTAVRIMVSVAFVATMAWATMIENTLSAVESFYKIGPLHIVLNLALVFGCLNLESIAIRRLQQQSSIYSSVTPTLFGFAGLSSSYRFWSTRRSYSSCWQIAVFVSIFVLSFVRGWDSPAPFNMGEKAGAEDFGIDGLGHAYLRVRPTSDVEARSAESHLDEPENIQQSTSILERSLARGCKAWSESTFSGASYMAWAFGIWCIFSYLNFSLDTQASIQSRHIPTLDLAYQPEIDLDIVLNMYDENPTSTASMISEIRSLPNIANKTTRVLIYYKGEEQDDGRLEALKQQTGATELIKLPNIGREGEAYLNHIITRHDDLARHTLFLQAHVHNAWELKRRIKHYFVPRTGVLNLGFSEACDCDDCWDRHGWHDDISKVYQSVYSGTCSSALLSNKGQFIVSSERIRGLDGNIYNGLREALVDPTSWAHQEPYLRGRKDSMSAPRFGYTLERMWWILFQCSEMGIVNTCPTLLSGTRSGGELADCQCLDGAPAEVL